MTIEGQYSTSGPISATITNININGSVNNNQHFHHLNNVENGSVNSSMSSSSSSCSIAQQQHRSSLMKSGLDQQNLSKFSAEDRETDSGIEKDEQNQIFIRISISDQNIQVNTR